MEEKRWSPRTKSEAERVAETLSGRIAINSAKWKEMRLKAGGLMMRQVKWECPVCRFPRSETKDLPFTDRCPVCKRLFTIFDPYEENYEENVDYESQYG